MSTKPTSSILVVDDDAMVRQLVSSGLEAIEDAQIFVVEVEVDRVQTEYRPKKCC